MTTYTARYRAVLASSRWREVRKLALRRAGFRCEHCGARRVRLDAHHWRGYSMLGREMPSDLKMLCHECHLNAHGRGRSAARHRTLLRLLVLAAALYLVWHFWH